MDFLEIAELLSAASILAGALLILASVVSDMNTRITVLGILCGAVNIAIPLGLTQFEPYGPQSQSSGIVWLLAVSLG